MATERRQLVEDAARRVYLADQAIQQEGGITEENLKELGDAYQEYVRARVSHEPDVIDKISDFLRDP